MKKNPTSGVTSSFKNSANNATKKDVAQSNANEEKGFYQTE